jgi:hypothetical protein
LFAPATRIDAWAMSSATIDAAKRGILISHQQCDFRDLGRDVTSSRMCFRCTKSHLDLRVLIKLAALFKEQLVNSFSQIQLTVPRHQQSHAKCPKVGERNKKGSKQKLHLDPVLCRNTRSFRQPDTKEVTPELKHPGVFSNIRGSPQQSTFNVHTFPIRFHVYDTHYRLSTKSHDLLRAFAFSWDLPLAMTWAI